MNVISPLSHRRADQDRTPPRLSDSSRLRTPQFGTAPDRLDRADCAASRQPEMPPLLQAVRQKDFNRLKALMAAGANVDEEWDMDGTTPLLAAAEQNQLKIVDLLIQAGADLNKGDSYDRTPLMVAALEGHYHMAQLLLSAGASAHLKDEQGKTALTYAIENDYSQLAQLLLTVEDAASSMGSLELLPFATEAASQDEYGLLKALMSLPALQPMFWPLAPGVRDSDLPQLEGEPNHVIWQCLRQNGLKAFLNKPLG